MRRTRRTAWRAAIFALGLWACAPSAAVAPVNVPSSPPSPAGFIIQLHRPAHPGDSFHRSSHVEATQSIIVQQGEETVRREEEAVRLDLVAVVTVLEVDPNGRAVRAEYQIESCMSHTSGTDRAVLPPGTTLTVQSEPSDRPFSVGGEFVNEETEQMLRMLIPTSLSSHDDDVVFGTKNRHPIGGQWPIDASAMAAELDALGARSSTEQVTGEVELEGVVEVDGQECLKIRAEVWVPNAALREQPPDARVKKSQMQLSFSTAVPTDASLPRFADSTSMSADFVLLRGEAEDQTTMRVHMERHQDLETRPLSPEATPAADATVEGHSNNPSN